MYVIRFQFAADCPVRRITLDDLRRAQVLWEELRAAGNVMLTPKPTERS